MSIVTLTTRKDEVVHDVVDALEEMLEAAKAGEFVAVAIVAVRTDKTGRYLHSKTDDGLTLLGAVDALKGAINAEVIGIFDA